MDHMHFSGTEPTYHLSVTRPSGLKRQVVNRDSIPAGYIYLHFEILYLFFSSHLGEVHPNEIKDDIHPAVMQIYFFSLRKALLFYAKLYFYYAKLYYM